MKKLFFLSLLALIGLTFTSCESNKTSTSGYTSAIIGGKDKVTTSFKVNKKFNLPDPCQLVSKETLSELFNVDPIYISAVDGNLDGNKKEHRACFFKWDDPNYPNTAILIQMQTNTMEDEYEEWMAYSVANKRTGGETMMGDDEPHIFDVFPNIGTDGSYNYDIGKYYWRIDNDLMIMLAYNMEITKEDQYDSAYEIASELMNNLSKNTYPARPAQKKQKKT